MTGRRRRVSATSPGTAVADTGTRKSRRKRKKAPTVAERQQKKKQRVFVPAHSFAHKTVCIAHLNGKGCNVNPETGECLGTQHLCVDCGRHNHAICAPKCTDSYQTRCAPKCIPFSAQATSSSESSPPTTVQLEETDTSQNSSSKPEVSSATKKRNMIGFGSPMKTLKRREGETKAQFRKRLKKDVTKSMAKMAKESYEKGSVNTRNALQRWMNEFDAFCKSYTTENGEALFIPPYTRVEHICVWLSTVVLPRGQKTTNEPLSVSNLDHIEAAMKLQAKFESLETESEVSYEKNHQQITQLFEEVRKRLINNKKELVEKYLMDFAEERLSFLSDEIFTMDRFLLGMKELAKKEGWLDEDERKKAERRFKSDLDRYRARAMVLVSFMTGARGDSLRGFALRDLCLVHLPKLNRENRLHALTKMVAEGLVPGKVNGEAFGISEGADTPYGLMIRTLVGKNPEDIKSWKVHYATRNFYVHFCAVLAMAVLMFAMHGADDAEIVFEREKVWGMSAIPNRSKSISYHVQVEDTTALCKLLDISSMKKTHGFRYACIKLLSSIGVSQEMIDKFVGWSSKLSTGSRVYDHTGCPVDALYAMAAREKGQIPLRMKFNDANAEKDIEQALMQWSDWLHIDEKSSPEEKRKAEIMKDNFEAKENRGSMLYLRKQVFPWLWKWIERFHGNSAQAEAWRVMHPQSDIATQRFKFTSMKNMTAVLWHFSLVILQDFTSPNPLEEWNAEGFDREHTFGRVWFAELYDKFPIFSTAEFLAFEEKAVLFYKNNQVSPFEFKSFAEQFSSAVNESYEHLLEHQQYFADSIMTIKSDVSQLRQQIESLSSNLRQVVHEISTELKHQTVEQKNLMEKSRRENLELLRDFANMRISGPTESNSSEVVCVPAAMETGTAEEEAVNRDMDGETVENTLSAERAVEVMEEVIDGPRAWVSDPAKMEKLARWLNLKKFSFEDITLEEVYQKMYGGQASDRFEGCSIMQIEREMPNKLFRNKKKHPGLKDFSEKSYKHFIMMAECIDRCKNRQSTLRASQGDTLVRACDEIRTYCTANRIGGASDGKLNPLKKHLLLIRRKGQLESWGSYPLKDFKLHEDIRLSKVKELVAVTRNIEAFQRSMKAREVKTTWDIDLLKLYIEASGGPKRAENKQKEADLLQTLFLVLNTAK